MADVLTVMWKEWKALFYYRGSQVRGILRVLAPVLVIGLLFPWQFGRAWLSTPFSFIVALIVPLTLAGVTVPESFAGERERHTLPTLLASRLPDEAILYGKLAVSILYSWVMSLIVLAAGIVIINAAFWNGHVSLFQPVIGIGNVVFCLLVSGLVSGLGVFISLRAATVQGATQLLMFAFLIPSLLLGIIPTIIVQALPDGAERFRTFLSGLDLRMAVVVASLVVLAIDLLLVMAARAKFKRDKLILD